MISPPFFPDHLFHDSLNSHVDSRFNLTWSYKIYGPDSLLFTLFSYIYIIFNMWKFKMFVYHYKTLTNDLVLFVCTGYVSGLYGGSILVISSPTITFFYSQWSFPTSSSCAPPRTFRSIDRGIYLMNCVFRDLWVLSSSNFLIEYYNCNHQNYEIQLQRQISTAFFFSLGRLVLPNLSDLLERQMFRPWWLQIYV